MNVCDGLNLGILYATKFDENSHLGTKYFGNKNKT